MVLVCNKYFVFLFRLFGSDETVGRQMIIYLAQYLLENYNVVPEITKLVDTTDIFLMPSMNPDGYNRSKVCVTPKNLLCLRKIL